VQDNEGRRDDVPIADAVDQERDVSEPGRDEEDSAAPPQNPPLEASPSDWHEQTETVELDPDERASDV
jgi:hypothetical protein